MIQSLSLAEVHDVSFNQPSSNSQELSSNDDKDSVFELVISDDQPPTSAAIPKIAGRMNTPTLVYIYIPLIIRLVLILFVLFYYSSSADAVVQSNLFYLFQKST